MPITYSDYTEKEFLYSGVQGIASMFGVCRPDGYGICRLYSGEAERTANIIAHELGHVMGVYHDNGRSAADSMYILYHDVLSRKSYISDAVLWFLGHAAQTNGLVFVNTDLTFVTMVQTNEGSCARSKYQW